MTYFPNVSKDARHDRTFCLGAVPIMEVFSTRRITYFVCAIRSGRGAHFVAFGFLFLFYFFQGKEGFTYIVVWFLTVDWFLPPFRDIIYHRVKRNLSEKKKKSPVRDDCLWFHSEFPESGTDPLKFPLNPEWNDRKNFFHTGTQANSKH